MRNEGRRDLRHDLPGDGLGTIEAKLTGGAPRSLRNAGIVIDAASRQPERLEELVQCVFSADEIVRMRPSDALERSAGPTRPWLWPDGRYLIRSRVRTLPMARSVACGSPSPWGGSVKRATILVPVG